MLQECVSYLESGFVIKRQAWPSLVFLPPGMMEREGLARGGLLVLGLPTSRSFIF